jgi:hypothetical protein
VGGGKVVQLVSVVTQGGGIDCVGCTVEVSAPDGVKVEIEGGKPGKCKPKSETECEEEKKCDLSNAKIKITNTTKKPKWVTSGVRRVDEGQGWPLSLPPVTGTGKETPVAVDKADMPKNMSCDSSKVVAHVSDKNPSKHKRRHEGGSPRYSGTFIDDLKRIEIKCTKCKVKT